MAGPEENRFMQLADQTFREALDSAHKNTSSAMEIRATAIGRRHSDSAEASITPISRKNSIWSRGATAAGMPTGTQSAERK